ncbi:MAG: hypothetical protein JOY59_12175 [Candidatus Eremiobacteraeota bacterium]|nr:hypothetical protein [Candidatus Eremiobacteraeota bacterium]
MQIASFLLRFVGYAMVLAIAYALGSYFWYRNGLDGVDALADVRALGFAIFVFAPFLLALVGAVARSFSVFVLFFLVGAMLTAPFALARLTG